MNTSVLAPFQSGIRSMNGITAILPDSVPNASQHLSTRSFTYSILHTFGMIHYYTSFPIEMKQWLAEVPITMPFISWELLYLGIAISLLVTSQPMMEPILFCMEDIRI